MNFKRYLKSFQFDHHHHWIKVVFLTLFLMKQEWLCSLCSHIYLLAHYYNFFFAFTLCFHMHFPLKLFLKKDISWLLCEKSVYKLSCKNLFQNLPAKNSTLESYNFCGSGNVEGVELVASS